MKEMTIDNEKFIMSDSLVDRLDHAQVFSNTASSKSDKFTSSFEFEGEKRTHRVVSLKIENGNIVELALAISVNQRAPWKGVLTNLTIDICGTTLTFGEETIQRSTFIQADGYICCLLDFSALTT